VHLLFYHLCLLLPFKKKNFSIYNKNAIKSIMRKKDKKFIIFCKLCWIWRYFCIDQIYETVLFYY